jgi:hypothetical protein
MVMQTVTEVRTVREVGSTTWPMLTRTNYGDWAVHMKWKLCARRWWAAVETGGANEDAEVGAMEALLASTPPEYHQSIGAKGNAKDTWELLASIRLGSERVRKAKTQQLWRDFEDLKFRQGETVEEFALRLQGVASQLATRAILKNLRSPAHCQCHTWPPWETAASFAFQIGSWSHSSSTCLICGSPRTSARACRR